VQAFDDCFLLAAIACFIGILPALFLKGRPSAAAAHGGGGRAHAEPVEM
jgi:hypothetical protein